VKSQAKNKGLRKLKKNTLVRFVREKLSDQGSQEKIKWSGNSGGI